MVLRLLHVLAMGAGTCDVAGDMWKLSCVYPAQPISVPLGRFNSTLVNPYSGGNPQQCFGWILCCAIVSFSLLGCPPYPSDLQPCIFTCCSSLGEKVLLQKEQHLLSKFGEKASLDVKWCSTCFETGNLVQSLHLSCNKICFQLPLSFALSILDWIWLTYRYSG